jgi:hypothetical protein
VRSVEVPDVLAPTSCPIFHLEGFPDVPVLQPGLPFYLDLLQRREGFAFVKRTHGFWDSLVFLSDSATEIGARVDRGEAVGAAIVRDVLGDVDLVVDVERRSGFVDHFRDQFYTELVEDLQSPLRMPSYIEASSFRGYPNSEIRPALHPVQRLRRVYRSVHTSGRKSHDALVWKQAILDGTFWLVVEAIRDISVVLIGPPHLSTLGQHLGLKDFHHLVIPIVGAPGARRSLLQQGRDTLRRASEGGRPAVVLYQAGALAYWLIYRLFPLASHTFHLDVGRCLDVWYPEVVGQQEWFGQNGEQIIANMRLEHLYH